MVVHAEEIINFAKQWKGILEEPEGSNDGPKLRELLGGTFWEQGQPYCYYGAMRCVAEGFGGIKLLPDWISRGGSCSGAYYLAKSHDKISASPATGAIFLLKGGDTGHYHAGIVTKVDLGNGIIETIEFNTNLTGSPEGIGCYEHTRCWSDADYIIW